MQKSSFHSEDGITVQNDNILKKALLILAHLKILSNSLLKKKPLKAMLQVVLKSNMLYIITHTMIAST